MTNPKPIRNYPFRGKIYTAKQIDEIVNSISFDGYTKAETDALLDTKQNVLTAGDNITISEENVISALGSSYTAGDGIVINNDIISTKEFNVLPSLYSLISDGYITKGSTQHSNKINKDYNTRRGVLIPFTKIENTADSSGGYTNIFTPLKQSNNTRLSTYDAVTIGAFYLTQESIKIQMLSYYCPITYDTVTIDGVTHNIPIIGTETAEFIDVMYTDSFINSGSSNTYYVIPLTKK